MKKITQFEDLENWKKGMQFAHPFHVPLTLSPLTL